MRKIFLIIAIIASVISACKNTTHVNTSTTDTGVVVNGIKWATRNVGKPGTFAPRAEDAGMFYQWNSKAGWPSTGDMGSITATDGSKTWNSNWNGGYTTQSCNDTWITDNDPSPKGWRLPTYAEIQTLIDTSKVIIKWTMQNGVSGMKFTDKTTSKSLFLPASGYRETDGSVSISGAFGFYWTSSSSLSNFAYNLYIGKGGVDFDQDLRERGNLIHSVVK